MEKRSQRREGLTSCGEERNHGVKRVCEYLPKTCKTLGSWIEGTALFPGSPKIVITLKDCLQNYCFPKIIPASPAGLVKHLTTAVCFTSNKAWPWKSSLGPHSGHLLSVKPLVLPLLRYPGLGVHTTIQNTASARLKDPTAPMEEAFMIVKLILWINLNVALILSFNLVSHLCSVVICLAGFL